MVFHFQSLIVVLVIAWIVFAFARAALSPIVVGVEAWNRRRAAWFLVTLAAYISPSIWIFAISAAVLLFPLLQREDNKLAIYFMLLLAVPPINSVVSILSVPVISFDYLRLLSVVVLFPRWLALRGRPDTKTFGSFFTDKLLAVYICLVFVLSARESTVANVLRNGIGLMLDIYLPYFVASRECKSFQALSEALVALLVGALIQCGVAVFESLKGWLLYSSIQEVWGIDWGYGEYLLRGGGLLRATATSGHPIVLGFVSAVAIALWVSLRGRISSRHWYAGFLVLVSGLLVSFSRGPWVGAISIPLLVALMSAKPVHSTLRVATGYALLFGALAFLSDRVVEYLPFIGNVDSGSVEYRQQLWNNAQVVIAMNPWFGAFDVLATSEMEEMRQGQGIIDLVNTYLGVTLFYGLVGGMVFVGIFLSALIRIVVAIRNVSPQYAHQTMGKAIVAAIVGSMVIIATTSSILVISTLCWCVIGMAISFSGVVSRPIDELAKLAK